MNALSSNAGNLYKYLDMCAGDFYNIKKILTYGKPWNFITGSRSVGKSTGIACFFVLDFLKNEHLFSYTRRTKDETLLTCRNFFDNAIDIIRTKAGIPISRFYYEGGEYFLQLAEEEKPRKCGMIIPLSQEQKYKSGADLAKVCNLVYDEFIASDPSQYLGSREHPDREYNALISLYQTIDRGVDRPYRNETRFFYAGNTMTIYNPLFLKLGISDYIESNAKIISPKDKLWILQQVPEVAATATIKDSFAYLLSDDATRDYAYNNTGRDTDDFVRKPPQDARVYVATLSLRGERYGVWTDSQYSTCYIDRPRDDWGKVISLDGESHREDDLTLITSMGEIPLIKGLFIRFKKGKLFFANGRIKSIFYKYFKLSP